MSERAKLDRQPEWNKIFEGWAKKYIAKNMWRVEGYDPRNPYNQKELFQDLIQDAYLTFRHILASYPLITEPNHIMALFQTALRNEFIDKAKYKQRKYAAEVALESLLAEDLKLVDTLGEENNEGFLRVILDELPPEIRAALAIFNDEEKLKLLQRKKVRSRLAMLAGFPETKESLNEALCRVLHLPKSTDLVGKLKIALSK